jgi:F-type H+-transporting ATPase subunit b
MIDIDVTLFIQLANFLVLIVILSRILYRPLLRVLEERRQRTEGTRAQVDQVDEQRDELLASYEADIALAHSAARATVQERAGQAEAEVEHLLAEVRGQVDMEAVAAAEALQKRRDELTAELAPDTTALAHQIASKVLGRPV